MIPDMPIYLDILCWILLGGGIFFVLVGAAGTLRLPDMYSRLHAASVTDTLGTLLVLAGLAVPALYAGLWLVAVKLLFILLFLWLTSPVSSYALANAAWFSGLRPILAEDRREDKEQDT